MIEREDLFVKKMVGEGEDKKEIVTTRLRKLTDICKLFREETFIKHSRFYPSLKEYFIYNEQEGIYVKYDEEGFRSIIGSIFSELECEPDSSVIIKICNNFKVGPLSYVVTDVEVDTDLICFENGVLRLSNGEFTTFSPDYFLISKLNFEYDADAVMGPVFKDYLKTLCSNSLEKEIFIRSWFKILLCKYSETQTFIYVQGQAKTGKSVLGHLASCLIGDEATVVTSLRSLNNDPFEVYNLKNKQLIIVSDTESYTGDLSILKQVVGGDPLKGRVKFVQGNKDLYVNGILMIIGNFGINSQDSSGALQRRLRLFKADNVVKNHRPLLYRRNRSWGGPLVSELPGIFNWIHQNDLSNSIKVLKNPHLMIPSVSDEMTSELVNLDPLLSWVQESIEKGPGCYVGYNNLVSKDTKDLLEIRRRSLLYPSYALYCKQRGFIPIKHVTFSSQLLNTLRNLGYNCSKVKLRHGIYINGVSLKTESFQTDTMYGGPVTYNVEPKAALEITMSPELNSKNSINPKLTPEVINILDHNSPEINTKTNINNGLVNISGEILEENLKDNSDAYAEELSAKGNLKGNLKDNSDANAEELSAKGNVNAQAEELSAKGNVNATEEELSPKGNRCDSSDIAVLIYRDYVDLLGKVTPEKKMLNSMIRKETPDINDLLNDFFKTHAEINENYKDLVSETFQKNILLVNKYGAIPYKYKRMGLSPRILPVNYSETLNSTKKILRNQVYTVMSDQMNDYSIVDFDLKSCYTAILLGLYPEPLHAVRAAIEGPGLWNHLKEEFVKKGKGDIYNKPAVKVCVYSSLFLGGGKAMMEGIMENMRKQAGLTKPDFRKSDCYEPSYTLAQDVASEMMNSGVVLDFRHIAEIVKAQYVNDSFICPTNQTYAVTEENFRYVFPNFLQSYEISLLGLSSLEVAKRYPEVQFIGHFHDGNVLLIPNNIREQVISYYKQQVTNFGFQLKLAYEQKLEVQNIF